MFLYDGILARHTKLLKKRCDNITKSSVLIFRQVKDRFIKLVIIKNTQAD
jgi:hypothetical protein